MALDALFPVPCTTVQTIDTMVRLGFDPCLLFRIFGCVLSMDRAPKAEAELHTSSYAARVKIKSVQLAEADYIKPP